MQNKSRSPDPINDRITGEGEDKMNREEKEVM